MSYGDTLMLTTTQTGDNMRSIKTESINPSLKLVAFHDKEWDQFKIVAVLDGKQLGDDYYSAFEDDKESILGTLSAEADFFRSNPSYEFIKARS